MSCVNLKVVIDSRRWYWLGARCVHVASITITLPTGIPHIGRPHTPGAVTGRRSDRQFRQTATVMAQQTGLVISFLWTPCWLLPNVGDRD